MYIHEAAIQLVTARLNVLKGEFQFSQDRNPIASISSRIKSRESMAAAYLAAYFGNSEIVTDLRNNMQNSQYCTEENEAYLSVAGHYLMYQDIFALPVKDSLNEYDSFKLNKDLFAYYPHPEFGGNPRQNNVVISGAKFEAVDYHDIFSELAKVDTEIRSFFEDKDNRRKEKLYSGTGESRYRKELR